MESGRHADVLEIPRQAIPWLAAASIFLFGAAFAVPAFINRGNPDQSRLAFRKSTDQPLQWVEYCLGADWNGDLSLRHRESPRGDYSTARLDNPVRRFVVDVADEGERRVIKAYTRHGEPFSPREYAALSRCLRGPAER